MLALPVKLMLAPLNTAPLLPIVPALTVAEYSVPLTFAVVNVPVFALLAPIAPVKYAITCPPLLVVKLLGLNVPV